MDEREKIIKIISEWYVSENYRCYIYDEHIRQNIKSIADALISAGIGDVTEWKERAEKAENALKEGVKCISPLPSAGFTINPIDVLREMGYEIAEEKNCGA